MEITKTPVLKEVYTDNLYQSTFMPIFQKAETKIKSLILAAFFIGNPKYILRLSIAKIIADVGAKIPSDLHDRDVYIEGLLKKSESWIRLYYDQPQTTFQIAKESLLSTVPVGVKAPIINTPKDLVKFVQSDKMWAEAKGSPNVVNYEKEVRMKLNQLAADPCTTQEPGKKPISLWQKAELDVRYEHQMQDLQNKRLMGVDLAWTSSHPNASKRCAPWQGKLMALEGHATMSGFRIGKVDGHWVYSLVDIMAQTDKYGYHNNIICGFNCRHRLIPYQKGTVAPKEYTAKEMDEQRKIEAHIRDMERNIRLQKTRVEMYNKIGEHKITSVLAKRVDGMVAQYKKFCEKNGYAWHKYRIEVK